jgi:hypothetical protein
MTDLKMNSADCSVPPDQIAQPWFGLRVAARGTRRSIRRSPSGVRMEGEERC